MNKVWEIVLAVVAGLGGVGVVFGAVIYFTSNFIAERLQKKYELKLNEKFEKYKADIDNKTYISKTKFDAEFGIYRSLSKAFFDMVKNISILIPQGFVLVPADKEQQKKADIEQYNSATKAVELAQDELNGNAPFIPENFYNEYDKIIKLCTYQLNEFNRRWTISCRGSQKDKETISVEAYDRTGEIIKKFKKLNNEIRKYLSNLDVLE